MLALCHNNYHEVCAIVKLDLEKKGGILEMWGILLTRKISQKITSCLNAIWQNI